MEISSNKLINIISSLETTLNYYCLIVNKLTSILFVLIVNFMVFLYLIIFWFLIVYFNEGCITVALFFGGFLIRFFIYHMRDML